MMGSPNFAQGITDAAGQVTCGAAPIDNTIIECDDSSTTSGGATRVTVPATWPATLSHDRGATPSVS